MVLKRIFGDIFVFSTCHKIISFSPNFVCARVDGRDIHMKLLFGIWQSICAPMRKWISQKTFPKYSKVVEMFISNRHGDCDMLQIRFSNHNHSSSIKITIRVHLGTVGIYSFSIHCDLLFRKRLGTSRTVGTRIFLLRRTYDEIYAEYYLAYTNLPNEGHGKFRLCLN